MHNMALERDAPKSGAPLNFTLGGISHEDDSMTKLIGGLVIFVFVLLIVGAKTVFGGAKRSWQKAKALANEGDGGLADDPEFEEKNTHLGLFLQAQEMLLNMGGTKPSFRNEADKLRYLHFVLGAVDHPRCQDSCRLTRLYQTIDLGRKVMNHDTVFTRA